MQDGLDNNLDFDLNFNIWEVRRGRDRSVLGNNKDSHFKVKPADIRDANAMLPTENRCKAVDDILAMIRPREAVHS